MNKQSKQNTKRHLGMVILLGMLISGCENQENVDDGHHDGSIFLKASLAEFYFGTRDVGSSATQVIDLINQSADQYTISNIGIIGASADQFTVDYDQSGTKLEPGERLNVELTFAPTSTGRKYSSLEVDHSMVKRASTKKSQLEQEFYRAKEFESRQEYDESLDSYRNYLAGDPVTDNKRKASIKVPVLQESANYGTENDFRLYTSALDDRETSDLNIALSKLQSLVENQPDSYLADDALYMQGYIQLMDRLEYSAAYNTMQELRQKFPDSSYYDTALYVEAIALKEMGELESAKAKFEELRSRHTGLSLELFNIEWPKDNYVSRLWFDRSNQGLTDLAQG